MGRDTLQDIKNRPLRATYILGVICTSIHCVRKRPDEASFRTQLLEHEHDLSLTSESTRNPACVAHLCGLETLHNEGRLRTLQLGLFSLLWRADYEQDCGLFEAKCAFTKPSVMDFHTRVMDVGVLGRWRLLDYAMRDFDVDPEEWRDR